MCLPRAEKKQVLCLFRGALISEALAAARCTSASGSCASRATFRPKDFGATPGVSLYKNVILRQRPHSQHESCK